MSGPSTAEWWNWVRLKRFARMLREDTVRRLEREKKKGTEWVERWRKHVRIDDLNPREKLFAVLIGTVLDYGVSTECVPLYVGKLREAGLLSPERLGSVEEEVVEKVLRKCHGRGTTKMDTGEPIKCKPKRDWYKDSAKWLINLGKTFDEVVKEFMRVLRDTEKDKEYVLTPSHIYLILRRIEGIGPKKAAMVARDALTYDHEMTILKILERFLGNGKKIQVEESYHTLIFMDRHTYRVFKRLGLLDGRGANAVITPQYVAALACPDNPGAVDLTIWYLGRNICRAGTPKCDQCPYRELCYYYNVGLSK